jgi:2-iminobutanoate/2-iminopropanoate deaminase
MSTPVGPYTPIVRAGSWLVCSGQLGLAPAGSGGAPTLVEGGPGPQLTQAVANAATLLAGEGASLADVVKTTVFATDPADFPTVNEAYVAAFGGHRPARSMVAVSALPMGAAVEIEVWALVGGDGDRAG